MDIETKDPEGLQKAVDLSAFLRMLEHGELHQEMSAMLQELNGACENHALENGGKAKAKLKLTISFVLEKGIYEIEATPELTLPKGRRGRTIAWGTPENFFSPQDPRQLQMFGGPRTVRDVISPAAEVRTV